MANRHQERANVIEALKNLLLTHSIHSQEEIKLSLESLGYEVNQTAISRLLRKLGAIKTTNQHQETIYALPLETAPRASKMILTQLIESISANENLIVIHTNPGSASYISRLIDHHRETLSVLGTVAGDDTIFIAPQSIKTIKSTLQGIQTFLAEIK